MKKQKLTVETVMIDSLLKVIEKKDVIVEETPKTKNKGYGVRLKDRGLFTVFTRKDATFLVIAYDNRDPKVLKITQKSADKLLDCVQNKIKLQIAIQKRNELKKLRKNQELLSKHPVCVIFHLIEESVIGEGVVVEQRRQGTVVVSYDVDV